MDTNGDVTHSLPSRFPLSLRHDLVYFEISACYDFLAILAPIILLAYQPPVANILSFVLIDGREESYGLIERSISQKTDQKLSRHASHKAKTAGSSDK